MLEVLPSAADKLGQVNGTEDLQVGGCGASRPKNLRYRELQ